jgi:hypothetical protein
MKIETNIGYERKIPKWNKIDIFDVVLKVIAGVDVGMGICVSVSGLMGALIRNCTFLVKLLYFIMI